MIITSSGSMLTNLSIISQRVIEMQTCRMYFRNLSSFTVYLLVFAQLRLHGGKGEFSSEPAPLHKAAEHQENTRLTLVFSWCHVHLHTHTHTHGKAVSRNTQASHPELSERSRQKAKKKEREQRRSYKDS